MFCAKCGGAIPEGGAFCVTCGTPARPLVTADGRLKRPGVVTLLAILDWIGGGLSLLIASLALFGMSIGSPAERDPVAMGLVAVMWVIAAVQVLAGVGLWRLRPYGRRIQIVTSCVGLLAIPLGTIISIAILIYLFKPGIKLLFSGKPVASHTAEELSLVAAASGSSGAAVVLIAAAAVLVLVFVIGIVAAIAVPGLLRARIAGNEATAIGRLRAFTSAETSYALGNRLLFDRQECLVRPSDCIAGYSGPAFLQERLEDKSGYRFAFYPGPAPTALPDGASRSSMTTYVLTATPISNATGQRQFCVDHTGEVREAPLTAELPTSGPSCPPNWSSIR